MLLDNLNIMKNKMWLNLLNIGLIIIFLSVGVVLVLNIIDALLVTIFFVAFLYGVKHLNVSIFKRIYYSLVPTLLVRIIPIGSSEGTSNLEKLISDSTFGSLVLSVISSHPIISCLAVVGAAGAGVGYLFYKYWNWGGSSNAASTPVTNLPVENLSPEGPKVVKKILKDFEVLAREKAFQKIWSGPKSKVSQKIGEFQDLYNRGIDVNMIVECSDPQPTSKLVYKFNKELKKFLGETHADIYFKIRESVFKLYQEQTLNSSAPVDLHALQKHAVHVLAKDFPEINPLVDLGHIESLFALLELFIIMQSQ